jgi:hypothetical protein|tara:strand:- start:816 stop:959 length:144 start_codon:yes stop_codon:yes gene_type:complete
MYSIIGMYRGNPEEIDTADSRKEAYELMHEYRLAYGCEWSINIKRNK